MPQIEKGFKLFQAGDVVPLDCVYAILGLIPNDAYEQDDPGQRTRTNNNDSGETIRFVKHVTITFEVVVRDA